MAASTKQFHTRCQEEVYRQIKAYLDELVDEHFDNAEHCDFYLKYGSTVLEISIDPYEEDDAVIEVLAFCVQGVQPSFEMTRELLRLNSEVPLGAFSMVGTDVFFSHSFLGRRLRPEQFIASLDSVASISDEYDEKLVANYGGETALESIRSRTPRPPVDARQELKSSSTAIPVYAGAKYRDDLTRRDSVMVKNQYGTGAQVFTLATDDSFPQVYHYYTTYLAQFRAYPPQPPFPPPQYWRTLEVQLNQAMQDPFIPGYTFKAGDRQITLQVAATEPAPKTVISSLIMPATC